MWVNNAMATIFAPMDDISEDDFRRATEVTYFGAVWGTTAVRRMKPRDRGVIVSRTALPSWMSSLRKESVKPRSAAFAAQYGACSGIERYASAEPT